MHLSGLFVYPVKSLRGCAVATTEIDALGLVGDRRFLVVDSAGRFLTQRTLPRMALIATALSAESLTLAAAGAGSVTVPRTAAAPAALRTVSIWKSEGLRAEDCGNDAAAWLTAFLGVACRLVRAGAQFHRPVTKAAPGSLRTAPALVGFPDAYPALVLSEASLRDLNDRLAAQGDEAVPLDRFRPNLVVADCAAFAEDTWPRVRIGDVMLEAAGPCARCIVTTTDQQTAARGPEPLRTLAAYRRDATDPGAVNFGQNAVFVTTQGVLRVGDPVVPG